MNVSEFGRKIFPIIYENRLFFRPKFSWFTPWKMITSFLLVFSFFLVTGIFLFNFIFANTSVVLGMTISRDNQPANEQDIYSDISFWEAKIKQFPNYRDAYIKLAILSWKIHMDDRAKLYLDMAKKIDPNNETVKKLQVILN